VTDSQPQLSQCESPDRVGSSDVGNAEFAELPADLQAKVQKIGGARTLANVWHFFNHRRNPLLIHNTGLDQGDREQNSAVQEPTTSDQRLKQLKRLIESEIQEEKSLKTSRMVVRVSKRVHLIELTARYMEEKQAKKALSKTRRARKQPRLSPMDRFTDLLFPETINSVDQRATRRGKRIRRQRKEGKEVSLEDKCPREAAKRTLEYWIRLGEPLLKMVERFGHGILLLLPEDLTDKKSILASLSLIELMGPFGRKEHLP
jgi:hypothetical protein